MNIETTLLAGAVSPHCAPRRLPPLGLYVHIPWCVRKCPYCDFNSHTAPEALPIDAYVEALLADLDADLEATPETRELGSIFFGGGTPSLMPGAAIARILDGVRQRLRIAGDCEITLEANPGTVEHDRFEAYRHAGVNRLSLGVQSFDDDALERLGRIHDAKQATLAVAAA
ncbi:MAG: radical SAM protein, partial [Lysobacterales bacterium]